MNHPPRNGGRAVVPFPFVFSLLPTSLTPIRTGSFKAPWKTRFIAFRERCVDKKASKKDCNSQRLSWESARTGGTGRGRERERERRWSTVGELVAIETDVPAREIFRLRGHDRCVWCAPVWKHTRVERAITSSLFFASRSVRSPPFYPSDYNFLFPLRGAHLHPRFIRCSTVYSGWENISSACHFQTKLASDEIHNS